MTMIDTKKAPQVSVVMAVFNCERYLEDAVESILNQTFQDFEFIIINDGSTDRSGELLDRLASKDVRIRLVHQENTGLTASLNHGLRMAIGELVARMDADDIALPCRFDQQVEFLKNHLDVVLLGGEVELVSEQGLELGPRGQPTDEQEIRRRLLLGDGGVITHPAIMFRRSVAVEVGGYDLRFSTTQDLDLFIRLSERGRITNLPNTVLKWRQHGSSVNRTRSDTWSMMKRMAVRGAIERMGVERYVESIFPIGECFSFPSDSLALSRHARSNDRLASAELFLKLAMRDPATRAEAYDSWVENIILRCWWYVRNRLRRLRRNLSST
jgi:glycosyltransferase involved in cell wall biosynthesis